ncbi:hypothetical protein, partial [Pseudomonas kulmbachensis]|uniref:hypothetical protein n=1 Tax=Pseudomonas kulmbachensis TaxID=3043408 RepID=UPI0037541CA2
PPGLFFGRYKKLVAAAEGGLGFVFLKALRPLSQPAAAATPVKTKSPRIKLCTVFRIIRDNLHIS